MSASRGALVSLEGCDGCGKTTQAALLCEGLAARGFLVGARAAPGAVIREPGGTPAGEAIREVLLHSPVVPAPWTEALLYAAARAELVDALLLPEIAAGRLLVLDRYVDSSLAYQGHARGLGIDAVFAVNRPGLQGVLPLVTLVIDLDPAVALARCAGADRIEAEGVELQRRVAEGFARLAGLYPDRVRLVDGGRPVDEVAADVEALALAALSAAGLRPGA